MHLQIRKLSNPAAASSVMGQLYTIAHHFIPGNTKALYTLVNVRKNNELRFLFISQMMKMPRRMDSTVAHQRLQPVFFCRK